MCAKRDVDAMRTESGRKSHARTDAQKASGSWWRLVPKGGCTCTQCMRIASGGFRYKAAFAPHTGCDCQPMQGQVGEYTEDGAGYEEYRDLAEAFGSVDNMVDNYLLGDKIGTILKGNVYDYRHYTEYIDYIDKILNNIIYIRDSSVDERIKITLFKLAAAGLTFKALYWYINRSIQEQVPSYFQLRTTGDPAVEFTGPAYESDFDRLTDIIDDLESNGVEVYLGDNEKNIFYGPSTVAGEPGMLRAFTGMSISAWEHEYDHFCMDRDLGYPGMSYYLSNDELRISFERHAYEREMELARSGGFTELEGMLMKNLEDEIKFIGGNGNG